jgi:hypothetical protein
VVRVLNRLKEQRGVPKLLFCDNGFEFTGQIMDLWAYRNNMKIDFSRPGKPTDKRVRGELSTEPSGQSAWIQTGSKLWRKQSR